MADKIVKLDIYGGLLGVGKTTLIKQMLKTAYKGCKVAIIENEIGKVNLDEETLADTGIEVKPLTSGCICCTVKGVFTEAVELLIYQEHPDYIIIEPTGAADFAVVAAACTAVEGVELNRTIMVVNGKKFLKLLKVAGEFLYQQVRDSGIIFFNFCEAVSEETIEQTKQKIWEINPEAHVICVPMTEVDKTVFPDGLVSFHGPEERKMKGIRIDAAAAGLLTSGQEGNPAGQAGTIISQEDNPAGHSGTIAGQEDNPAGQAGTIVTQEDNPAGHSGTIAGQEDRSSGEKSNPSGQEKNSVATEEKPAARIRASGKRGNETDSWIYRFTKPLTPGMKTKLDSLFCDEENQDLWRGKGYMTMSDGTICKIDYSYGDAYTETYDSFNPEKLNILVMIGKGHMKRKALRICKEIEEEG